MAVVSLLSFTILAEAIAIAGTAHQQKKLKVQSEHGKATGTYT